MKKHQIVSPRALGVLEVSPKLLLPNPHNPRMLFDKAPLQDLQDSIRRVGILVPLTVYQSKSPQARYVILDGQRRWICAQNLRLKSVPVNIVAEPDLVQNIVTMFQIHKLREDWELMPTALKFDVLMTHLGEKNERRLAAITGLDPAVVVRCKKLLSYPKKFQEMMLDPDPESRMRADFFIELYAVLNDRNVGKMKWFGKNAFTLRMLQKYHNKTGIRSVTDFRVMKQHINNAVKAGKSKEISLRLKEFYEDDELTLDHLLIRSASTSAQAKSISKDVSRLTKTISKLNVEDYYGEDTLWDAFETLMIVLRKQLVAVGRRIKA